MSSSRRGLAPVLALALAAAALAVAPVVLAQGYTAGDIAQARELLNAGLSLRDKGDTAGAIEKLLGAHVLVHTPITALELGRTYALVGRLVEARETFLSIERMAPRPEETERSRSARAEGARLAAQIRPRIPTLETRITGAPLDSVVVTIDGAAVPREALAAPRLVDPGSHRVVARSTGGGVAEVRVELKEGEARSVELVIGPPTSTPSATVSPAPAPPASPPAPPAEGAAPRSRSRALEWSLLAGGAAIGATGGVLMAVEAGKASDARNERDRSAYDAAATGWTAGLVGAIVGGAAVAVSGVLFAASPGSNETRASGASLWLSVGAGDVRLGGRW